MNENDLQKRYNELFPDDSTKAKAFDEIANDTTFAILGQCKKLI